MIYNPDLHKSTQKAFSEAMVRLMARYKNVVVLSANATNSMGMHALSKQYGDRFFNFGNAIEAMVGAAVGFTVRGKIPFVCGFADSLTTKAYNEIRNFVCASNNNIKLIGAHAGLLRGEEGIFHQTLEDVGMMRIFPNMKVACPADSTETRKIVEAMITDYGPTYLRLSHLPLPDIYDESYTFKFGKNSIYKHGTDVVLFSYGTGLHMSLEASGILERNNISVMVINISSVKPFDISLIEECARQIPYMATIEDHNIDSGLGALVSNVLSDNYPGKLKRIGLKGFGESGKVDDLFKKYRIDSIGIAEQVAEWMGQNIIS